MQTRHVEGCSGKCNRIVQFSSPAKLTVHVNAVKTVGTIYL